MYLIGEWKRHSLVWLAKARCSYFQPDCDVKLESLGSRACEGIGFDLHNYDITRHIVAAGTCIGFQNRLAKMGMQFTPTCSNIAHGPLSSLRSTTARRCLGNFYRAASCREYAAAQCGTSSSFASPGCERGFRHASGHSQELFIATRCLAWTQVVVTFQVSNSVCQLHAAEINRTKACKEREITAFQGQQPGNLARWQETPGSIPVYAAARGECYIRVQPIADNRDLRLSTCATQRHAAKPQAPANHYAQCLKLEHRSTCSLQTHGPYRIFTILSVSTCSNVHTMSSGILQAIQVCRSGSWAASVLQGAESFCTAPFQDRRAACLVPISPSTVLVAKAIPLAYLGEYSPAQRPPRR
ncbi:hypothetical protein COCHEDRAFT_1031032 [Bipolaris maydis C5]|uniref:Uncharacterized protein n=1 Tax=Cochliobolus heterostrophus (strain C5 / ATCC 48332 / race O) TaxID=701091 RepID=M2UNV7_COCH5|nr:hypothetical protein COCHEDRAFT_1031032 [Bipolaris maydis C5]KAJ6207464.1 hypothetical protein PSV09DRAFT_1031032 [Bipolaris maydis]